MMLAGAANWLQGLTIGVVKHRMVSSWEASLLFAVLSGTNGE